MIPTLTPSEVALLGAAFLASAVEMVEASTILLAMGVTRGWRSALAGGAAALVVLMVLTLVAGYAVVRLVPESLFQLVIGSLLLIFGLQWLRKGVLRAAGLIALHDEAAIYERETATARVAAHQDFFGLDGFAFLVSFKGVLLEGLEVVVVVLTLGLNAGDVPLAAAGAVLAIVPVALVAVAVRRPLAAVPENTIKFVVGTLLTTFGTFWAVEGLGVFAAGQASLEWPLGTLSIGLVFVVWAIVSISLVRALQVRAPRPVRAAA